MKKKLMYQKPEMDVIVLRRRQHLLAGSGGVTKGSRENYGDPKTETWGDTNEGN